MLAATISSIVAPTSLSPGVVLRLGGQEFPGATHLYWLLEFLGKFKNAAALLKK